MSGLLRVVAGIGAVSDVVPLAAAADVERRVCSPPLPPLSPLPLLPSLTAAPAVGQRAAGLAPGRAGGPCAHPLHGSLRLVAEPVPTAVVAADLDGDGDPDLAVVGESASDVLVLLNQGGGTFADPTSHAAGSMSLGLAAADLDGDLEVDLAVTNADGDDVSVLFNDGRGSSASEVRYAAGYGARSADLDGDTDADLVDFAELQQRFGEVCP